MCNIAQNSRGQPFLKVLISSCSDQTCVFDFIIKAFHSDLRLQGLDLSSFEYECHCSRWVVNYTRPTQIRIERSILCTCFLVFPNRAGADVKFTLRVFATIHTNNQGSK